MLRITVTYYGKEATGAQRSYKEPAGAFFAFDVSEVLVHRKDPTLKNHERAELAKACAMVLGVGWKFLLDTEVPIPAAHRENATRKLLKGITIGKLSSINNLYLCRGRIELETSHETASKLFKEVNAFTQAVFATETTGYTVSAAGDFYSLSNESESLT